MNTTILLDHGPTPDGDWIVRALLRIQGDAVPKENRVPLNLALVLDRSGSMAGEKLEAARDAAIALVRRLSPDDVVSVVTYDDEVDTVAQARRVASATDLLDQIGAIQSGGSTNLSGGWLRGRDLTSNAKQDRTLNRVLLLTDGLANVGIVDRDQLAGLAARGREDNITTTTIGFGADYDEELLRNMADRGGGNTYYIESPDQAPSIFAKEIEGLLGVAAQNVTVSVELQDAQLIAVHHSYPRTNDGRTIKLEIGDVYAAEPKSVLVELMLERPAQDATVTLARLTIRGVVVNADGSIEVRTIDLPLTLSLADGARVEPEVQREALLLEAARARTEARAAHDRGDADGAVLMLREAASKLRASGAQYEDVSEDAADLQALAETWSVASPSVSDLKYNYQRSHDAMRSQRTKSDLISRQKRKPKP
jgi:Ca-activated chloride channel homolog